MAFVRTAILKDWMKFNTMANDTPWHIFRHARYLLPANTEKFASCESISVCVALPDAKLAQRLLREGAFIHRN
jgi:hypothetical protein